MKKKLVLSNSILVTLIITIRTFFSCFGSYKINKTNQEASLRNELAAIQNVYSDETESVNISEARKQTMRIRCDADINIRITFLSLKGEVLDDSNRDEIVENHLQRPEIQNIGKIYYRHSDTLNKTMRYLACEFDSVYIRISKPLGSVRFVLWNMIILSATLLVAEIILVFLTNILLVYHWLKPLQKQLNRLSTLGGSAIISSSSLDTETISAQIDQAEHTIKDKIQSLRDEEEKLSYIINTRHQGLIVINTNWDMILINSQAKSMFNYKDKPKATLTDITIEPDRLDFVRKAQKNGSANLDYKKGEKYYLLTADFIKAEWVESKSEKAIAISIFDRTNEKQLENSKRDFFAHAGHELKTPLTTIIGFSEMIKNGFLSDKEEIENALNRIIFESKRRDEIVKQRLDLSRLETENRKEDLSLLSRKNETENVLEEFDNQIKEKRITCSLCGDDFIVEMKEEDCAPRIKNLIENSIRYNKDGGLVKISLNAASRSFIVSDTGIGIPNNQIPRIFERFYRVDKAHSRKLGGTGLGLSIVKHTCRNYGIKIEVKSKEGVGSDFILTFPKES